MVSLEKAVLQFWDEMNLHSKLMEKNKGKPTFSFFDGPITANNPMGVHHAWGRTYKDVVQRYKAMCGFDQRYQNGFDTQGLWLEVETEKALGLKSKKDIEDFGLENFVQACKDRLEKYSAVQTEQSKRLGQTMDWQNSYYTHTDENVSAIWYFLKVAHEKGWLYKGKKPMPWCGRCGTSLSNHEQADSYKQLTHRSPFVKFKLVGKEEHLLVWTTTPWTLTANQAVAVHPELKYGLFLAPSGETLVAGLWLKDGLLKKAKLLTELPGSDLEGLLYETPFTGLERQSDEPRRVYLWKEVSDNEGTGLVHVAPGCGAEDYELGQLHDLASVSPLNEAALFKEGFGQFSGLSHADVSVQVLEDLEERNLLFKVERYTHKYPVCWRCGEELVFRLSDEWFLSCDEVRPLMQVEATKVKWEPKHVGKLFQDWLKNMGDWCVSRKRYWGLPLPFYECSCGHLNVLSSKEEFFDRAVGDLNKVQELHLPWVDEVQVTCETCNEPVSRVLDVGDCWLDAGVMPFSTVEYFTDKEYWNKWFPADFVCEMREQVRLWFYSTMFMGVTLEGRSPYQSLASYEKVHDKDGKEMHKSWGNAVWFDDAVEVLGADTLRLFYLSQNPSKMMKFDVDKGKSFNKPLMTLWNVLKFFTALADMDNFQYSGVQSTQVLDKWVLSELDARLVEFKYLFEEYKFRSLYISLEEFLNDLSSWYVRRSRRRFWAEHWTEDKQFAMNTLYQVLLLLSKLMAPLTPFFAELVYQTLRRYSNQKLEVSVHLCEYPDTLNQFDERLRQESLEVRNLVSVGLKLRSLNGLRVRQPLNTLFVWSAQENLEELLSSYQDELQEELNVKKVEFLQNVNEFLDFHLVPKYELLGPKLGKKVHDLGNKLNKMSPKLVKQWLFNKNNRKLRVNGFSLAREEVEVRSKPKEGFDALSVGEMTVFLDTRLSPKLLDEGLVRDFVRHVQMARKGMDLQLNSQVSLQLQVSDHFWKVLVENKEFVLKETQTKKWEKCDSLHPEHLLHKFSANDGDEVQFMVNQVVS
ncbi:MAG: isoleucine--tRNA ligase [Candidatus Kariarchaeaceae archaeon]